MKHDRGVEVLWVLMWERVSLSAGVGSEYFRCKMILRVSSREANKDFSVHSNTLHTMQIINAETDPQCACWWKHLSQLERGTFLSISVRCNKVKRSPR